MHFYVVMNLPKITNWPKLVIFALFSPSKIVYLAIYSHSWQHWLHSSIINKRVQPGSQHHVSCCKAERKKKILCRWQSLNLWPSDLKSNTLPLHYISFRKIPNDSTIYKSNSNTKIQPFLTFKGHFFVWNLSARYIQPI